MQKLLFKTLIILLSISGLFVWLRADASVLAGTSAFGMDDPSGWLAANSQDPAPFNLLEAAQTGYLRIDLPFNEVSATPGAYTWAYQSDAGFKDFNLLIDKLNKRGIQPVIVLSGGPAYGNHLYPQQPIFRDELLDAWTGYVRAAVQQFGGQVDYWQVGSMINDPVHWGKVVFPGATTPIAAPDPELYADMLKIAYTVIKSARSTDTVLLGSLAYGGDCAFHPISYLQALEENDVWYAFDAVSLDLPALNDLPETAQVDACDYAPIQTSGKPLADAVRAVDEIIQDSGAKPLWLHDLSFQNDLLEVKAAARGTLPEVAESDYLARATAVLLAEGGADRVFWRYDPLNHQPGPIAMQSFANLSQSLGGSHEISAASLADGSLQTTRFRGGGKLSVLAWRAGSGDEFIPTVIPGFDDYDPRAWSADAASLKNRDGIELPVDQGGSVALLISERPVIISGKPADIKRSVTLILKDSASQAGQGLKGKFTAFFQAQKARAAEKVGAWVDEQQQSLMDTIKESFNQWLRKSLGLARL